MTPEDAPPTNEPESTEPDDSDEPYGPEYLNWKPTTAEDFGPGEEMIRDMFFAFRDEWDAEGAVDEGPPPSAGEAPTHRPKRPSA